MCGHNDSVVHPFALAARRYHTRPAQICKVSRNLGLALPEDLDEIADAHFPSVHEVQQSQASAIAERRKQHGKVVGFAGRVHATIVYALTNMSNREYIRFSECKEAQENGNFNHASRAGKGKVR